MANRWFNQFKGSLEKGVVQLDGYVSIHADTGAVTSETLMGASVARTAAGTYTITLEDQYPKLLAVAVCPVAIGTFVAQFMKVKQVLDADDVDCGASLANVKKIVVCTCNSSGVPTDAVVEAGFTVHLVLKNSTV